MPTLRSLASTSLTTWPSNRSSPAARQVDAGEHEQARRFAAAGRAEKRDELAVLDDQRHAGDHLDVAEALATLRNSTLATRQPFTPPIDICMR